MIEFANPLFLLLFPFPYIIYKLMPAHQTENNALRVPFFSFLIEATNQNAKKGSVSLIPEKWQKLIIVSTWILLVIGMAKPMFLGEIQKRELSGRDVMFVLDLSGSMAKEDFKTIKGKKTSRLVAAKKVLSDFVEDRKGDRFGLILFGDNAYLQSPFTADHKAWISLLEESDIAMAGQSTHLGDAIGLSIKVFSDEEKKSKKEKEKLVIILTDGNDTDSIVSPKDASIIAASKGVKIHIVAMGDPLSTGEEALDLELIKEVTEITGGKSYLALSTEELRKVYKEISNLEPETYESLSYQPKVSMHHIPLQIMLVLFLLIIIVIMIKNKKEDLNNA